MSVPEEGKAKVPYARYAFHNLYNYTALSGIAAAAVLTQNWWLGILGLGAEALWMVFGPDSRLLRRLWFDKVHEDNLRTEAEVEKVRVLSGLPNADAVRVRQLELRREEILRLCTESRNLSMELLREELAKLDQLTRSFFDLVVTTRKSEEYLARIDLGQLEEEMRGHEVVAQRSKDEDRRKLSQQNLAVLMKRKEKLAEIKKYIARAHGQMELIENTFQLLTDQIVTMRSPKELGGQLDELIDGVEAVRTSARETEALLEMAR